MELNTQIVLEEGFGPIIMVAGQIMNFDAMLHQIPQQDDEVKMLAGNHIAVLEPEIEQVPHDV